MKIFGVNKEGRALSVKCSPYTKLLLSQLFKNNKKFINLEKYGVVLNPSWFFKFSACFMLKNFSIDEDIGEFAYNCHYVNFLDKIIKNEVNSL